MWCSRCLRNSTGCACATHGLCTTRCSTARERRCKNLLPTPNGWAHRPERRWCCTLGARTPVERAKRESTGRLPPKPCPKCSGRAEKNASGTPYSGFGQTLGRSPAELVCLLQNADDGPHRRGAATAPALDERRAGTARLGAALAIGDRLGELMLLIRKNHAVPRCCGTDRKGPARTKANGHNQLLETDRADKSRTRFLQKTGKVPVTKQGKHRLKTHSTRPIRAKKNRHYCLGSQVVPASFNKTQPPAGGIVGRGWFVRLRRPPQAVKP